MQILNSHHVRVLHCTIVLDQGRAWDFKQKLRRLFSSRSYGNRSKQSHFKKVIHLISFGEKYLILRIHTTIKMHTHTHAHTHIHIHTRTHARKHTVYRVYKNQNADT